MNYLLIVPAQKSKEFQYFFEAWIAAMTLPIYSVIIGPHRFRFQVQPKLSN